MAGFFGGQEHFATKRRWRLARRSIMEALSSEASVSDPLFSVITTSYQSAATIDRTIASVHRQPVRTEHIFIDGGSTDETLEIIRKRLRPGDTLVSERDEGISDAMNKGIQRAQGEFVAILHSDDWFSPDQLPRGGRALQSDPNAGFAFGDVHFYRNGLCIYRERGDPHYASKAHRRMPTVPHPSILYRRACLEQVGPFRTDLRLAMDYEWLLRSVKLGVRGVYVPDMVAHMTHDGASNRRFEQTLKEVRDIAISHGRPKTLAEAERVGRLIKTGVGRQLEVVAPDMRHAVRRLINPQLR